MNRSISLFTWNVRGLNDSIKCGDILSELLTAAPDVVLLQETKLSSVPPPQKKYYSFLPRHLDDYSFIPSYGAVGGVLTAWNSSVLQASSTSLTDHTLSVCLSSTSSNLSLYVTNVYGPPSHNDRQTFLDELRMINPPADVPWILIGDFNMIRFPHEKNNTNFHPHEANAFNDFVNDTCLIELPLLDRAFTWSNKRSSPTLERLDRAFINLAWDAVFPNSTLSSMTRRTSDHVPLIVHIATSIPKSKLFRFDNYWTKCPGFRETVTAAWYCRT